MFQQATRAIFKISAITAVAILGPGSPSPVYAQATPYLGQMMYAAFNFPPKGWALCNGQILPISQNAALFSLLGTFYGGNGTNTFALPNMQGRVPVSMGEGAGLPNYNIGQVGGSETETLTVSNLPAHAHSLSLSVPIPASSGAATVSTPSGSTPANTVHSLSYSAAVPNVSLSSTVTVSGNTAAAGSASPQPFSTMPPYLTVNCVIALSGIFPSRN